MNNTAIVSGTVWKYSYYNGSNGGKECLNLTIMVLSDVDGKNIKSFIPIQITMPYLIQRYKDTLKEGSKVVIEGRFETYTYNGKTGYNVTQVTSLQQIDQGDMVHVIVWGRICTEPVYRTTVNGNRVASFMVANTRTYKKGDEWVNVDSFIPVNAWGLLLTESIKKFHKGQAVWIIGRLNSRSYDNKSNQKVYLTEILADSVIFGGSGKRNIVVSQDGSVSKQESSNNQDCQHSQNNVQNTSQNQEYKGNSDKGSKQSQFPQFPSGYSGNGVGDMPTNKSTKSKPTSFPQSHMDKHTGFEDLGEDEELPFS